MTPQDAAAGAGESGAGGYAPAWKHLLPALGRLDERLTAAVAAARAAYGPEAVRDPFRGLHITPEDVQRLLARSPGAPFPEAERAAAEPLTADIESDSRLAWLQQAFGLSRFDLDLIIIALAPELDLRYERLYAFLQDDVSRRRAGVDLALNLLCACAADKIARRAHLAADAPLIAHGLIHLLPDPQLERAPLLAHALRLDPQILRLLLGEDRLDERLAGFCVLIEPDGSPFEMLIPGLDAADGASLLESLTQARAAGSTLRLYFQGVPGIGRRTAAEGLAASLDAPLLRADLARLPEDGRGCAEPLRVLFREAWLQDALLYLDDLDALRVPERAATLDELMGQLAAAPGIVGLAGTAPWPKTGRRAVGVQQVRFRMPDAGQRQGLWRGHLDAVGIALDGADLDALAERFRLTPAQIADAAGCAASPPFWADDEGGDRGETSASLRERLFAAARAQCGQDLDGLATKLTPVYGWDDIVLPQDTVAQLHELCQRVRLREPVMNDWGFGRKLSQGKGVSALFAGPSGTGKTMAAEVIANALGLDLYRIDLAGVISKYIGETEKNLDRIFRAAEDANAILLFDEADALFGKRSEVRDSHDRYANIEISYLLQKMEQYEGVAILATNLKQNLDEAFVRRLAFTVHFPAPDEGSRREIWNSVWPNEVPLAETFDLDHVASQFKLTGGNIKNIAMAASFLASEDKESVGMDHVRYAIRREMQKMGKSLSTAELSGNPVIPLKGRRA
ncbi:ATP-binding protein [Thiococcus pfennigii]|uniref:ATP-binding protein n=1 Tax=Thiococcus pfennigii TaxID=1057 RepID=UPI0019075870|nr:ATP-binding protein [Thiococcus pfennigii]MBK1699392.1 hypothetical protein [Thiococcus pfennigii]